MLRSIVNHNCFLFSQIRSSMSQALRSTQKHTLKMRTEPTEKWPWYHLLVNHPVFNKDELSTKASVKNDPIKKTDTLLFQCCQRRFQNCEVDAVAEQIHKCVSFKRKSDEHEEQSFRMGTDEDQRRKKIADWLTIVQPFTFPRLCCCSNCTNTSLYQRPLSVKENRISDLLHQLFSQRDVLHDLLKQK